MQRSNRSRERYVAACIICKHPLNRHDQSGCGERGVFRGACTCTFAAVPPLPPDADAAAHRARSDWWDQQARLSWALALDARDDLDRWYPLMRFHRDARRLELGERLAAEALVRPDAGERTGSAVPSEPAVIHVGSAPPPVLLSQRLASTARA